MTIPEKRAAVVLTGQGGLDKLVYSMDVPVPRPADGEVLIRITACGMNNTYVWVRQGAYGTEDDPSADADD
ncbi:Zn-dependent oxidoreductase, partial [Rhizobium ruizarguesonis]